MRKRTRILSYLALAITLAIGIYVTPAHSDTTTCTAQPPAASAAPVYSGRPGIDGFKVMYHSMWEFIQDNYYDPSRLQNWQSFEHAFDDKLGTMNDIEVAFKSLAEATNDKWTTFITQQDMRDHALLEKQGLVTGGLMLYPRSGHYQLDVIHYGSAAYNTNLRERDTVVCLNNVAIQSLSRAQVDVLLRGNPGDKLTIKAIAASDKTEYEVVLALTTFGKPKVEGKLLANNIAYIRMPSFAGESFITDFVEQFTALATETGGTINGLVLDLRNNHGGELPAATKFSSLFLDDSKVVTQSVLRGKPIKPIYAEKAEELTADRKPIDANTVKTLRHLPMVILVNGSSASATEVTLGALKDNTRGTIIGVTSFGKGVGYKTQRGPVGGLMSITAFKYLTPNGNEVHEIGITPDISVLVPRGETKDVQLEAAVTRLQGELLNNH
ncbi:MAG: hypothetical protein IPO31_19460 [Candidatus Obscuribacter sp.]|nr:hypothetical protein [Candidatus Obscuribacter sp.]